MWENGISRFSCHFARMKVFLGVKKYNPRIRIQLPFHQGTEMYRLMNRSSKEITKNITNLRGKCNFLQNQGQITLCIFTFSCYLPVITNFSKTKMLCWLQKSHSFFKNMYRFQDIWRIGNSRFWREKRDFPFFVSFSFIQSMSRCKEVYSQNHNSITFLSRHWNV